MRHNVRFLINLDELDDREDLLSDDLGAWIQTKTRKKWYKTRCDKRGKVEKVFKVGDDSDVPDFVPKALRTSTWLAGEPKGLLH